MLNNWFKKEKPFAGFAGFGGGATGLGFAGGGGGGIEATGGIKYWNSSENGGTMYHVFQSPGTFNVTTDGDVEVLIVGGGGSGADGQAGGGGGGGVVHGATVPVTGSIPVVVGDGGQPNGPGGSYNRCGYRGGSSSFDGVTAIGGGGGSKNNYAWGGMPTSDQNQVSGANCGGGGGGSLSGSGVDYPSAAILPQPVPGSYVAYGGNYGAPAASFGGGSGGGGGGAGASSPGPANPRGANVRSPGGAGKAIPSFNGTNISVMPPSWKTAVGPNGLYGGGGGGGEDGQNGRGNGGPGGGGDGQSPNEPSSGAVTFTGGGGGDRGAPGLAYQPTAGAKGIVIVKYQSEQTSDVGTTFGGQQYTIGNYTYHVFSAGESSLFVDSSPVTYDILVVAGGGAGGSDRAAGACGGGGGGGVIYAENQTMGPGSYNVFVGSGGATQPGAPSPNPKGDNGGNSLFSNATIPGTAKVDMSGHSMPATTWFALGGGGGAGSGPGNANITGRQAGTGGGGGSQTGGGGAGVQTTQSSLPSISRTYGSGNSGRTSQNAYPARGGGGGGHTPGYGQGNANQGGGNGYQVPESFLPTSVPADFANLLGANHPTDKGGGISTNSPEWRYFAGGGAASDNVPATNNSYQGSGGLGGGGNAGGEGRTSPSNPRTAFTGNRYYGVGYETSPGVHGRGGGGSGNGLDNSGSSYDYFGGTGGDGIIIVRVHNS
jgi:hypothetical protein